MPFLDRADAGRRLASLLAGLPTIERGSGSVVVGLPRGGIPVAYEIARALGAPLDVILVRKVGLPAQPELAMGAIGEDGIRVVNEDVVRAERVSEQQFAEVEELERAQSSAARSATVPITRGCRWPARPRSWWTTGSRPAPPHGRPAR